MFSNIHWHILGYLPIMNVIFLPKHVIEIWINMQYLPGLLLHVRTYHKWYYQLSMIDKDSLNIEFYKTLAEQR